MEFMDIRKGSDAEFGQSIYEPFGIAQVEPLSFGAICVVSNVCGCCGFIHRATEGREVPNVVVADYTQLQIPPSSLEDVIHIGLTERNAIEVEIAGILRQNSSDACPPPRDVEICFERHDIASRMSWEVVVENYFLPGLKQAL